jgi:hypothetical protein
MKEGQIVIVIDTGNYKASYSEKIPFKAELYLITDYPCYWVRSLVTGKEYELYESQILEGLSIEEIGNLLDMSQYGL